MGKNTKKENPIVMFLAALVVALAVLNIMMIIKLVVSNDDKQKSEAFSASVCVNNLSFDV